MAARVAAELSKQPDVQVVLIKGGLGQFDVLVDGRSIVKTNRFWYPRQRRVLEQVLAALKG